MKNPRTFRSGKPSMPVGFKNGVYSSHPNDNKLTLAQLKQKLGEKK